MTPVEALLMAAGWVAAAAFGGLWWGERMARKQANSFATHGHPDGSSRAKASYEPDATEKAARKEYQRAVETIEHNLEREARKEGREVSGQRIREEAERIASEVGIGRRTT